MSGTLSQRLQRVCEEHSAGTALLSRNGGGDFQPTTFAQLWSEVATSPPAWRPAAWVAATMSG